MALPRPAIYAIAAVLGLTTAVPVGVALSDETSGDLDSTVTSTTAAVPATSPPTTAAPAPVASPPTTRTRRLPAPTTTAAPPAPTTTVAPATTVAPPTTAPDDGKETPSTLAP